MAGRAWGNLPALADRPAPGLGPLGGLAAALLHARALGIPSVLSAPCDTLGLPLDLARRLAPGPSVVAGHWLVGLWPSDLAGPLMGALAAGVRRARDWVVLTSARPVPLDGLRNLNRPADAARWTDDAGSTRAAAPGPTGALHGSSPF